MVLNFTKVCLLDYLSKKKKTIFNFIYYLMQNPIFATGIWKMFEHV